MDPQSLFNLLGGAAMATLGWVARHLFGAIKSLESDLAAHKVEVARDYATNSDLLRMEDKLDKIIDKLSA